MYDQRDATRMSSRSIKNSLPRTSVYDTHSKLPRTAIPPNMTDTILRRVATIAVAIATVVLDSCATMPDTDYPPSREFELIATFLHDTRAPLSVPSSTRDRTIYELSIEPGIAWRERFLADGTRQLTLLTESADDATDRSATGSPASGSELGDALRHSSELREIRVRCRGRLYGRIRAGSVEFVPLESLFPGARRIELRGANADRP